MITGVLTPSIIRTINGNTHRWELVSTRNIYFFHQVDSNFSSTDYKIEQKVLLQNNVVWNTGAETDRPAIWRNFKIDSACNPNWEDENPPRKPALWGVQWNTINQPAILNSFIPPAPPVVKDLLNNASPQQENFWPFKLAMQNTMPQNIDKDDNPAFARQESLSWDRELYLDKLNRHHVSVCIWNPPECQVVLLYLCISFDVYQQA